MYAVRSLRVPPPLLWEPELLRDSCGCDWVFVMAGCGLGKSKNKKLQCKFYLFGQWYSHFDNHILQLFD